jgi:hypothetical protein
MGVTFCVYTIEIPYLRVGRPMKVAETVMRPRNNAKIECIAISATRRTGE